MIPRLQIGLEGAIFGALGAERLPDREVPLVALIWQQQAAIERSQRERHRERLLVGHRIVNGELVLEHVVGHTLEPFRDDHLRAVAKPVAVATDAGPVRQVRRLDDELVAFPAGPRITEQLPDAGRDMWAAIRVHDTCVVNHLVTDRHHSRRLHDAVAVAIHDTQHRTDNAARNAAVVEA